MRTICGAATAVGLTLLGGCTTLSSGIAVAPPGVNRYAFRECLLARGFYSPQALTGIALRDWRYRHRIRGAENSKAKPPTPRRRYDLLEQSDSRFVIDAAQIIAGGLMPATELRDDRVHDRQEAGSRQDRPLGDASAIDAGSAPHSADAGLNAPYVELSAPQQFEYGELSDGSSSPVERREPSIGYPPGRDWRLNRFLDCYIAPVGEQVRMPTDPQYDLTPANAFENGDDDLEGRLLRGHILLALLASYGTELVISRPGRRQVAQAELLLGHIRDAETALRGSSVIMSAEARLAFGHGLAAHDERGRPVRFEKGEPHETADGPDGKPVPASMAQITLATKPEVQPVLRWKGYTTRLLRVFQVGVDIQRVDAQQTLDRASNLVAAFSGQPGNFIGILQDGLKGVVTTQKVRIYGNAYMRDARESLSAARRAAMVDTNGHWVYQTSPITRSWRLWDVELRQACTVLATIAKKEAEAANCVPDAPLMDQ